MVDEESVTGIQRTSIVIGHGRFGLEVLRRLLESSAMRGALQWDEGGPEATQRKVRGISLLHIEDISETSTDSSDGDIGDTFEITRDLRRQIRTVARDRGDQGHIAEVMDEEAKWLLDASKRASRADRTPLGLDVIVVTRCHEPDSIARLDNALAAGMSAVANNASLRGTVAGVERLNFIKIMDFDNYWDASNQGRAIREALLRSVENAAEAKAQDRPTFGRIYLSDTCGWQSGHRNDGRRTDETCLFLEFLLFGGHRGGDLQYLYQTHGVGHGESPIGTFGVRLLERNSGLLSYLSAASFSIPWLSYLATDQSDLHPRSSKFLDAISPFHGDALADLIGVDDLHAAMEEHIERVVATMADTPRDDPEWAGKIQNQFEACLLDWANHLSDETGQRMGRIHTEQLADLPARLATAIDEDLAHPHQPLTLGSVVSIAKDHIETLEQQIPADATPVVEVTAAEQFRSLTRLQDRFQAFLANRVDLARLRSSWWPAFALFLTAALVPVVSRLVDSVPVPSGSGSGIVEATLDALANPLIAAIPLWIGFWAVGAFASQGAVAAIARRARAFHDHPRRGRMVDGLWAAFAKGVANDPAGSYRSAMERLCDGAIFDFECSIRNVLLGELVRVERRLELRRREMEWLRGQLDVFRRIHGKKHRPDATGAGVAATGLRHSITRPDDDPLAALHNKDRFRSEQSDKQPFRAWNREYCPTFLDPLGFLDQHCPRQEPAAQALRQDESDQLLALQLREYRSFLNSESQFDLAFDWPPQKGVDSPRKYCVLPKAHNRVEIRRELADTDIEAGNILPGADTTRTYLLGVQTGVEFECLVEVDS